MTEPPILWHPRESCWVLEKRARIGIVASVPLLHHLGCASSIRTKVLERTREPLRRISYELSKRSNMCVVEAPMAACPPDTAANCRARSARARCVGEVGVPHVRGPHRRKRGGIWPAQGARALVAHVSSKGEVLVDPPRNNFRPPLHAPPLPPLRGKQRWQCVDIVRTQMRGGDGHEAT